MEKNLKRAKELFEKEPNVKTAYFTSDGNMFRAEHYARDWAKGSNSGEVLSITREEAETGKVDKPLIPASEKVKTDTKVGGENSDAEEKAELTKRYIELFDGKPNHLIGIKKLKELIAAKELEIKNTPAT